MERVKAEKEIRAITDKIVREYQPEKIILFGSWAWGEPHEWSDADLLVVKRSDKPRMEREREVKKLLPPLDIALDILVYTPAELEKSINENHNLFMEDIIRNGKTLYARQGSPWTVTLPDRPLVIV